MRDLDFSLSFSCEHPSLRENSHLTRGGGGEERRKRRLRNFYLTLTISGGGANRIRREGENLLSWLEEDDDEGEMGKLEEREKAELSGTIE